MSSALRLGVTLLPAFIWWVASATRVVDDANQADTVEALYMMEEVTAGVRILDSPMVNMIPQGQGLPFTFSDAQLTNAELEGLYQLEVEQSKGPAHGIDERRKPAQLASLRQVVRGGNLLYATSGNRSDPTQNDFIAWSHVITDQKNGNVILHADARGCTGLRFRRASFMANLLEHLALIRVRFPYAANDQGGRKLYDWTGSMPGEFDNPASFMERACPPETSTNPGKSLGDSLRAIIAAVNLVGIPLQGAEDPDDAKVVTIPLHAAEDPERKEEKNPRPQFPAVQGMLALRFSCGEVKMDLITTARAPTMELHEVALYLKHDSSEGHAV